MVQVLTTDKGEKQGVEADKVIELVDYVITSCENLKFVGLMSIGDVGDIAGFHTMHTLKQDIEAKYSLENLELSIGTSADYEMAIIEGGSTEI